MTRESEPSPPFGSKQTHLYPGCLGMNKVHRQEGIAHHLPPALGICPGLYKSKGKP